MDYQKCFRINGPKGTNCFRRYGTAENVDIIAGAVCKDHVYLSVAIPPKFCISNFMGYLKGKSTLMKQYRNISKSRQKDQGKKNQEVPLYKRTSNNACGTALRDEQ